MDSEDELAGILGHEIAHVYARHISQKIELAKKVGWAQLAGMAAGVLLGAAGGGGAAASALTMGSAATGVTAQLSFSRENETQADQLGLKFLTDAGYGTEGLLRVLKKIRGKQWFSKDQVPTYMMTHPAIEDRIAYVTSWIEDHKAEAKPTLKTNPAEFERILTRLIVEYNDATAESGISWSRPCSAIPGTPWRAIATAWCWPGPTAARRRSRSSRRCSPATPSTPTCCAISGRCIFWPAGSTRR